MHITKIGHCCLLIELKGKRILTDPGSFTEEGLITTNIDIVLITHEHADHFHIPSLKRIVEANPEVAVFTNSSVGKLLAEAGIPHTTLEGRAVINHGGVAIEAYDGQHAEIYQTYGQVQNTGYFIGEKLFYPGDSYIHPQRPVPVLAFPIGGPWCKIADAVRYVLAVKPYACFPVHDGIERLDRVGVLHRVPQSTFPEQGIDFRPMKAGDTEEF